MGQDWQRQTMKLPKNHGWKSKPGYQIFVADRGAVRFDFPVGWEVAPGSDAIRIYDRTPPEDNCVLQFSMMRLPEGVDWSKMPVAQLLAQLAHDDERQVIQRGEIVQVTRDDIDVAWEETNVIDAASQRPACSRTLLARAQNIQALITFDFWFDDLPRLAPVWDEIVRSLQIGGQIQDPTRPISA
ncbi:MAG TPA: hypothetical protein VFL82_11510 [Thermomicrobiales bacterium]|nr:hypothetical protein [Thermomicrobiales bacterium]